MSNEETVLYRHFSEDGSLLYVGISLSWPQRTRTHARKAEWFSQVAKVTIERFPSRGEALAAERDAIRNERPKHNIIHNQGLDVRSCRTGLDTCEINDPYLEYITGPEVIVGPALIYREDVISMMVAYGSTGSPLSLCEVDIGRRACELPKWADSFRTVLVLDYLKSITMDQARSLRNKFITDLKSRFSRVDVFSCDRLMAFECAERFPCENSRRIRDEVLAEVEGL